MLLLHNDISFQPRKTLTIIHMQYTKEILGVEFGNGAEKLNWTLKSQGEKFHD